MSEHPREGDHVAQVRAILEESARVKRDLARETAPFVVEAAEWIAEAGSDEAMLVEIRAALGNDAG